MFLCLEKWFLQFSHFLLACCDVSDKMLFFIQQIGEDIFCFFSSCHFSFFFCFPFFSQKHDFVCFLSFDIFPFFYHLFFLIIIPSCVFLLAWSFFLVCPMFFCFVRESSWSLFLNFFCQSSLWASYKNRFVFEKVQKIIDPFLDIILFEKPFFLIVLPLFAIKLFFHAWSSKTSCHLHAFSKLFLKNIYFILLFLVKKKKASKK